MASAMFNVAQQAGASLDTALLGTLAASAAAGYGAGQVANQVHGYHMASLGSAVILLVAAVVAVVVINTRLTDRRDRVHRHRPPDDVPRAVRRAARPPGTPTSPQPDDSGQPAGHLPPDPRANTWGPGQ